jgi:hypothetical protein
MRLRAALAAVLLCSGSALAMAQPVAYPPNPYPPPPPPRAEMVPGPRHGYVWQPGHYRWTGVAYAWVPGRWVGRRTTRWVEGRWAFRYGAWHWVPGHWG